MGNDEAVSRVSKKLVRRQSEQEKYLEDLRSMWTTAYIRIKGAKDKSRDGEGEASK